MTSNPTEQKEVASDETTPETQEPPPQEDKEEDPITPTQKKVKLNSPEGILMLSFAGLIAIINIILGLLDYGLPGSHALLSPIVNGVATVFIGGWIWTRGDKSTLSKIFKSFAPFALNTIPIPLIGSLIALIPYWLLAVWTNLEK